MLVYHLMKNAIDTTLVETAPYGSGAEETTEETIFPSQFTPEPNSEYGAVPPMQWSWLAASWACSPPVSWKT